MVPVTQVTALETQNKALKESNSMMAAALQAEDAQLQLLRTELAISEVNNQLTNQLTSQPTPNDR
eukprot:1194423-Prorocentrum_minimum.AAC.18